MEPILEIENLSAGYQNTVAIDDVTFEINKGDFVGIVGPNGSGKTTLLKAILGLVKIFKGDIKIFGGQLTKNDRHKIGYVPQKEKLNSNFPASVKHIVLMGRYAKIGLMKSVTKKDREIAYEAIKKVELEEFIDSPYSHLSGGQQQRVLIARALAQEPDIMFLDEPTSSVDVKSTLQIMNLISSLNKEYNLTILLVAHDINLISKYVTKLMCLNKNICGFGLPYDVLTKDVLKNVYKLDIDVFEDKDKKYAAIHDKH